jgi:hypothetical protein
MATGDRPGFQPSQQHEPSKKDHIRSSEQLAIREHHDDGALTLHVSGVVDSITVPQLATGSR